MKDYIYLLKQKDNTLKIETLIVKDNTLKTEALLLINGILVMFDIVATLIIW